MSYIVPSEFVIKMVDAGESKIHMSTRAPESSGYITLMNMNSDPTLEEMLDVRGCDFATFIEDLIKRNDDTICNPEPLEAFHEDLGNSDYGTWAGKDGNQLLYMVDMEKYFIYLIGPDGQLIQVATNMLSNTEALKSIVMSIAQ